MSPIVKKLKTWGLDDRRYSISTKFMTVFFCFIILFGLGMFALYPAGTWFHELVNTGQRIPYPYFDDTMKMTIPPLACIGLYLFSIFLGIVALRDTGNLFFVATNYTFFVATILALLAQSGLFVVIGKHLDYHPFEFAWQHIHALKWQYLVYGGVGVTAFFSLFVTRLFSPTPGSNIEKPTSGKLGSAEQASNHYLEANNLLLSKGLARKNAGHIIGKKDNRYVALPDLNLRRHTLVVAPGRAGKTSSLAIPRILDADDNLFILDVKSELFQTTYEESIRKGKIPVAIDPYNILSKYGNFEKYRLPNYDPLNPVGINLEDPIRKDQYVDAIVEALTVDAKFDSEHFTDAAKATLGAIIDDYIGSGKTLVDIHDIYAPLNQEETAESLQGIKDRTQSRRAMSAMGLLGKVGDKEAGSMLSTLYRSFDYVAAHVWSEFFGKPGVDIDRGIVGNCDLYLIIPTKIIKRYPKVVRLMLQMYMIHFDFADQSALANRRFQVMLDEVGRLKATQEIEEMVEIYGEKGICVSLFFQNVSQIDKFEKADLIKAFDIIQIFAANDIKTIDWVQRLGGKRTIVNTSYNTSTSENKKAGNLLAGQHSKSKSENLGEMSTDLYHSNEIRELPYEQQFVFMRGLKSFICDRIFYPKDKRYKGRFGINYVEQKELIEHSESEDD